MVLPHLQAIVEMSAVHRADRHPQRESHTMKTTTLERPRSQPPAALSFATSRLNTRLVGRWLPDINNPAKMKLVWMTEAV